MSARQRLGEVARARGEQNESRVEDALNHLISIGKLDRHESSEEFDRLGIDFIAIIGSKRYKIQVKSSWSGVERAREEYHNRDDIIFIVPKPFISTEKLADIIMQEIDSLERRFRNG